jgi:hypothetical protein
MAFIRKDEPTPMAQQTGAANTKAKRSSTAAFFKSEADLCALFIREFNAVSGWTCYPEAAGFDVLVVHDDGCQIGVEAKLVLNAKVADQILPSLEDDFKSKPGPDYRMVIVGKITEANAGIAKLLGRQGVPVLHPISTDGITFSFRIDRHGIERAPIPLFNEQYLFDWNPPLRCQVPMVVSDLPAGVAAPIQLTPWKEAALKVIALMRKQGFIMSKQIAEQGIGTGYWTQPKFGKQAWLAKGTVQGSWLETEHMPPFDKQHPEAYSLAVQSLKLAPQHELKLA